MQMHTAVLSVDTLSERRCYFWAMEMVEYHDKIRRKRVIYRRTPRT